MAITIAAGLRLFANAMAAAMTTCGNRQASSLKTLALAMIASLIGTSCGPRLPLRIEVPTEYQRQPAELTPPPNGDSEQVRYRQAYEAFWWNCTILKSVDLEARCPFTCSGTPAATAGCRAGAEDAENQIAELEKKYGRQRTQEFLAFRIGEDAGYSKIERYFPYGPMPEKVPDR